jgi:hypothetical protein
MHSAECLKTQHSAEEIFSDLNRFEVGALSKSLLLLHIFPSERVVGGRLYTKAILHNVNKR